MQTVGKSGGFYLRLLIQSRSKKRVQYVFLFVIFVFCVLYYRVYFQLRRAFAKTRGRVGELGGLKIILYANSYYDFPHFSFGEGRQPFLDHRCPVNTCFATDNRFLLPEEEFDAVLFHMGMYPTSLVEVLFRTYLETPLHRKPHQRYVYFNLEPPDRASTTLKTFDNFFNWTITYRLDSDIPQVYGWMSTSRTYSGRMDTPAVWKRPEFATPFRSHRTTKTKLVAWFVSKCVSQSGRECYVQELSKYLPLDVYGTCGKLKCSKSDQSACYEMLETDYKFYLSFENSMCKDYATEKLFNIMHHRIVPVVYGGADYKVIAPPMSYIDTRDFKSPKELADYLLYLDKHEEEYNKYFWWKELYTVQTGRWQAMCKLCEMLHQDLPSKTYKDIYSWWNYDNTCHDEGKYKQCDVLSSL